MKKVILVLIMLVVGGSHAAVAYRSEVFDVFINSDGTNQFSYFDISVDQNAKILRLQNPAANLSLKFYEGTFNANGNCIKVCDITNIGDNLIPTELEMVNVKLLINSWGDSYLWNYEAYTYTKDYNTVAGSANLTNLDSYFFGNKIR